MVERRSEKSKEQAEIDAKDAEFARKRSRWLDRAYYSSEDIAAAYRYFVDRTNGLADQGQDPETMNENILIPSTGSAGGDHLAYMRSLKMEIERVVLSLPPLPARCWYQHRVNGDRVCVLVRELDKPRRKVENLIMEADHGVERKLT